MAEFDGLGLHLGNLSRLSSAKTRSISPENLTGEKGKGGAAEGGTGASPARGLGRSWKVSPSIAIAAGERLLEDVGEAAGLVARAQRMSDVATLAPGGAGPIATTPKLVGNYGESFDRNVGAGSPLKIQLGQNALWSKGGQQYGIPVR